MGWNLHCVCRCLVDHRHDWRVDPTKGDDAAHSFRKEPIAVDTPTDSPYMFQSLPEIAACPLLGFGVYINLFLSLLTGLISGYLSGYFVARSFEARAIVFSPLSKLRWIKVRDKHLSDSDRVALDELIASQQMLLSQGYWRPAQRARDAYYILIRLPDAEDTDRAVRTEKQRAIQLLEQSHPSVADVFLPIKLRRKSVAPKAIERT